MRKQKNSGSDRASGMNLRTLWDKAGFYVAVVVCVALVGGAAWYARSRPPYVPPERTLDEPAQQALNQPAYVQTLEQILSAAPTPAPEEASAAFAASVWPVSGELLTLHSTDAPVWSQTLSQWQTHTGIDIAGGEGVIVRCVAPGKVAAAHYDSLLGNVIEVEHAGGVSTRYGAVATLDLVRVGDPVAAGQALSAVSNTARAESGMGAHVHFELSVAGEDKDPLAFLPEQLPVG